MLRTIPKPAPGEFAPYTSMYIDLLPDDGRVLDHLQANFEDMRSFVESLPANHLATPCAPGKWTVLETLVHIVDDERIYAYRALCSARGDTTELPGFEQDDYATAAAANARELGNLLAEYEAVRRATITLFDGLPDIALARIGISGNKPMSVRAAAYHIAGHEMHHLNLLRERYGV